MFDIFFNRNTIPWLLVVGKFPIFDDVICGKQFVLAAIIDVVGCESLWFFINCPPLLDLSELIIDWFKICFYNM